MIAAVTFDFWNTLLWEERGGLVSGRLAAWAGILEESGVAADVTALEAAHERAFQEYVSAWESNRQYIVENAVDHMVEELGFEPPAAVRTALVEAFATAGQRTVLHLADGVEDCLRRLKDRGVRLGIICDVGLTPSPVLRWHLEQRGLLDLFDAWTFSDDVGVYKPDRRIFEVALGALDAPPSVSAHVGDRLRTDVAGARAMGMVAVRYAGVFDDAGHADMEADLVVHDYIDLPALLFER